MTSSISTLNPSLANDIVGVVAAANRKHSPNSGQMATLSTLAMVQMRKAAQPVNADQRWSVLVSEVQVITRHSAGTVKGHIKFWVERGVLSVDQNWLDDRFFVNLGA
jgi:hypothetical protein